jgi:hypothetical protein
MSERTRPRFRKVALKLFLIAVVVGVPWSCAVLLVECLAISQARREDAAGTWPEPPELHYLKANYGKGGYPAFYSVYEDKLGWTYSSSPIVFSIPGKETSRIAAKIEGDLNQFGGWRKSSADKGGVWFEKRYPGRSPSRILVEEPWSFSSQGVVVYYAPNAPHFNRWFPLIQ